MLSLQAPPRRASVNRLQQKQEEELAFIRVQIHIPQTRIEFKKYKGSNRIQFQIRSVPELKIEKGLLV